MTAPTTDQIRAGLTPEQGGTLDVLAVSPVPDAILDAVAEVTTKSSGFTVPDRLLTKWARDLGIYQVAIVTGGPTEDQRSAWKQALADLADIRDGKYPAIANAAPTSPSVGHGGNTNIFAATE